MAYTVNKTNSSASPNAYTVQDSVLNTQTDISFVGKGYDGYGEVINENFLALLENKRSLILIVLKRQELNRLCLIYLSLCVSFVIVLGILFLP